MTHLLQPLDITTNFTIKKFKKKKFSNYIASIINKISLTDSSHDVIAIKIDLKLSTLKPWHYNTQIQIFNYFKTSDSEWIIKLGFQATGITNAIANARQGSIPSLDPCMYI